MNSQYEVFQRTQRFGSLDGLRCLSILAVIWHHAAYPLLPGVTLFSRGYLGVELFFAISGFLITTLLLREQRRTGTISLSKFYLRRTLRIFPLYYTVVLIYVVLVWRVERGSETGQAFFHNLPYYLTYTSNWFINLTDGRVIFYFAWSLAAEEQFYLLWPTVEKLFRGWRSVAVMVLAIAFSQAVAAGVCDAWIDPAGLVHRIIARVPLPICLGVLLAHLFDHPRGYTFAERLMGRRWSSLAAMVLVAASVAWAGMPIVGINCLLVLLVATCVIREDHWLAGFLGWRPIAYVGTISYGMYLMHMLAYNLVKRMLPTDYLHQALVLFVATFLVTTLVAGLSFRYYEQFFLRLKERFRSER